jgi:hypothetical protein
MTKQAETVVPGEEQSQAQAIAESGWGEIAKTEDAETTPKTETEPEKTAEPTPEEKPKTDDEIIATDDKDLDDAGKAKKVELVETKKKADEAKLEEDIKAYAKEYNLSIEEARKDYIEHIPAISKKYGDDAKQLSKANLHLQRLFTKTQDEAKKATEAQKMAPVELSTESIVKMIDGGVIKVNGKPTDRDGIIASYREHYADITEEITDDAVFKLAVKEIKGKIEESERMKKIDLSTKAKDKRTALLSEVAESDKEFAKEITPILEKTPDAHIMNENFSVSDMLMWAKGKKYDELKASIEQVKKDEFARGLAKGKEEAKIIGIKETPKEGSAPVAGGKVTLTAEQKQRALDMFDGASMTDEQKYQSFIEVEGLDKKKK